MVQDGFLAKYRWLTFLLPFIVYMLAGTFEPTPEKLGGADIGLAIAYKHYPVVYSIKILLVFLSMLAVLKGYLAFPLKISWLSIGIGVVGAILWIGICHFDRSIGITFRLFELLGLGDWVDSGTRASFNPLKELANTPTWAYAFLAIRFAGLALLVPVMEEFFLRGFLMRFVQDKDWWKIPFGQYTTLALVVGTAVPMLMHPGELLAALVWFSMITWLMLKTKNIWDCIMAHAITNLLLGVYVVTTGHWELM